METLKSVCEQNGVITCVAAGAVIGVSSLVLLHKLKSRRQSRRRQCPSNTVLLHQIPRGPYAPSLSPFPIKLETFLRMANIPYENDFHSPMSSKGKTPWMTYNGQDIADSQFCIEFLMRERGIDLKKNLSPDQRAVARALQVLVDEHLYWCVVYFRWILDQEKQIIKRVIPGLSGKLFVTMLCRRLKNYLWGQGMGRHSTEEIKSIFEGHLSALADYLGDKPFMMGDCPCEVDCSVFGILCQLIWHSKDDVMHRIIEDRYPHLEQYSLRMKQKFWPDWDACITHGGTREATK